MQHDLFFEFFAEMLLLRFGIFVNSLGNLKDFHGIGSVRVALMLGLESVDSTDGDVELVRTAKKFEVWRLEHTIFGAGNGVLN